MYESIHSNSSCTLYLNVFLVSQNVLSTCQDLGIMGTVCPGCMQYRQNCLQVLHIISQIICYRA